MLVGNCGCGDDGVLVLAVRVVVVVVVGGQNLFLYWLKKAACDSKCHLNFIVLASPNTILVLLWLLLIVIGE